MQLKVNGRQVKLSNLDKVFWPDLEIKKGDLINYYVEMYPLTSEFLRNRPLSLKAYPDGIEGHSFYQKNCPDHAPEWLSTFRLPSGHKRDYIEWITVNNLSDLLWVANRASIELHAWFSTAHQPHLPDFAVFDLDPGTNSSFEKAVETALLIKKMLDGLQLTSFVKTSGKRGLHVHIPLQPVHSYRKIRRFLEAVARTLVNEKPQDITIEWRKEKREGKLYVDYRQNARGKTLPVPYSLRPTPQATVSTPLHWRELRGSLRPTEFTMQTVTRRVEDKENPWRGFFDCRQILPDL